MARVVSKATSRTLAADTVTKIRWLRKHGLTREQIAAPAEVSEPTLRRFEGGHSGLRVAARAIETAVDQLAAQHGYRAADKPAVS